MDLKLEGRRALVTAATGGIGEASARMLAAEGAIVAVNGRSAEKVARVVEAIAAAGGKAVAAVGDVDTEAGVDAAVAAARAELGGVDILVNNFGGSVFEGLRDWFSVPPSDFERSYAKNVISLVRMTRHFAEDMRQARWGRVINVASIAALKPTDGLPEYAGSKAAVIAITKSLSHAFANTGVTANTVIPGITLTEAVRFWIEGHAKARGWEGDFDELQKRFAREAQPLPAGAFAEPEAIAYAIVMLASPLSSYITGANIRADGGVLEAP
ncbi:MAG: SDR family oxidoreductase [Caulobacteraceae bacterium]|nr:SDR family oxidoreductase [Caulobacteraceae bacterium]